jgi:hypothetical protein
VFRCIIFSGGGDVREDEYSHKGIDHATQIDKKMIESNEYRRKFDNATDNPKVNKSLYKAAKEILYDRSGTHYESLYWIDGNSGEVIAKFDKMGKTPELTGVEHELKVEYSESFLRKLIGYTNIVVIHNHPNSSAPSAGDFNSAFKNSYTTGFVVTHDGRVFKYVSHESISDLIYARYWQRHAEISKNAVDAQKKAIADLSRNFNISFEEVMRNDMV